MKIILVILSLTSALAWGNTCVPSIDNCDAYLCMEQKHSCGYKGYPLKFGYRFCQNFLRISSQSEAVTKWLTETRHCLQDKLVSNPEYNCQNLFYGSIKDHVRCYEETGYCSLNKKEKNFVKKEILKEFFTAPIYILKNAKMFFKNACRN